MVVVVLVGLELVQHFQFPLVKFTQLRLVLVGLEHHLPQQVLVQMGHLGLIQHFPLLLQTVAVVEVLIEAQVD